NSASFVGSDCLPAMISLGPDSFYSAKLRIERAAEHLNELKTETRKFFTENPYTRVAEPDPDGIHDIYKYILPLVGRGWGWGLGVGGGGRSWITHLAPQQRRPSPTPPHKGEGRTEFAARADCTSHEVVLLLPNFVILGPRFRGDERMVHGADPRQTPHIMTPGTPAPGHPSGPHGACASHGSSA